MVTKLRHLPQMSLTMYGIIATATKTSPAAVRFLRVTRTRIQHSVFRNIGLDREASMTNHLRAVNVL